MKIIIAGGREFKNYQTLCDVCSWMLSKTDLSTVTIVSGGARGVDQMGERFAKEHGIKFIVMKPDWDKHGKAGGYIRNQEMANASTHVIAFWDGKSRGTKHMIDIAKRDGLIVHAVDFYGNSINQKLGITR